MRVELYPVYSIYVYFDRFFGMELSDKDYYQIRFKLKTPVFCKAEINYEQASCPNVIYPPSISEGYGITKTIELSSCHSNIALDDCFRCTVQVLRRFDVLRRLPVQIVIELHSLQHSRPPKLEFFSLLAKRTLEVQLRLEKSLHVHRPILFDSTSFSAVTLTIHASLVSVIPVRKKLPPDPPPTEKLYNYYSSLCLAILSTKSSLQSFIRRYSSVLSSPVRIDGFSLEEECQQYEKKFYLSENGWATLEEDAALLSRVISQLFAQSVQMFARSSQLANVLYEEFDQARMKRLGELFFFSEYPIFKLSAEECEKYSMSDFIDCIKKSAYFIRMPKSSFYCAETDLGPDNRTIVLEESYLPEGVSVQPLPEIPSPRKWDLVLQNTESPRSFHGFDGCVSSFCLPLRSTNTEDTYILHSSKLNLFNDGKMSSRRMSDPGISSDTPKESGNSTHFRRSLKRKKARSTTNLPISNNNRISITRSASASGNNATKNTDSVPAAESSPSSSLLDIVERRRSFRGRKDDGKRKSVRKGRAPVILDKSFVQFVHFKEHLKQKLHAMDFQGFIYSDLARAPYRTPYFSLSKKVVQKFGDNVHLIIFVHGLEGSTEDLVQYRNVLRILLPDKNLHFLMSRANLFQTWCRCEDLAKNLLEELFYEITQISGWPTKISFVAHSMGGIIVRAMLGMSEAKPLLPVLHTLLTLNSPHCGLLYNQKTAKLGVSLMRWWKQAESLEQLCLRDAVLFRDTLLYKLSTNGVLGKFKYVLLLGSCQDYYVPLHSALISQCKAASKDKSSQGTIYDEMISNLNMSIENSTVPTTVVKYTVYHSFASNITRAYQVTGKAAHIAVIDDDVFIERLMAVSAVKYFM